MYSEVFGKGNFSHSCLKDLAPGTENKKSSSACVHRGHCLFWLIRKQVFFLKVRKQNEAGIEICTGGKERAGKWEQLTEGKVFFFPRFYYTLDSN